MREVDGLAAPFRPPQGGELSVSPAG